MSDLPYLASPQDPISDSLRARIDHLVTSFITQRRQDAHRDHPIMAITIDIALCLGNSGKRIRPAFGYWGYRAIRDDEAPDSLLTILSAIELTHLGVLIHDDIIDHVDTRRAHPAAHRQYEYWYRDHHLDGDAEEFGRSQAILLGDQLLIWSGQMAAQSASSHEKAMDFFHLMRSEVNNGQLLDICAQYGLYGSMDDLSLAAAVLEEKTSRYTVQRPVQIGACAAGADRHVVESLGDFGVELGIAFQLRDDLLGIFADESTTGKPSGADLIEGKRTIVVSTALKRANFAQRKAIERVLGCPNVCADMVEEAKEAIISTGADHHVEQMIATSAHRAQMILDGLDIHPTGHAGLTHLAHLCVDRVS